MRLLVILVKSENDNNVRRPASLIITNYQKGTSLTNQREIQEHHTSKFMWMSEQTHKYYYLYTHKYILIGKQMFFCECVWPR